MTTIQLRNAHIHFSGRQWKNIIHLLWVLPDPICIQRQMRIKLYEERQHEMIKTFIKK
jgi:hypothetical protein